MTFVSAPKLRRTAVAGAALLGLVLTGCSNASPGVVAYVGPSTITERSLDQAVSGLTSTLQAGQAVSNDAVVSALIQGEISEQIAAERGIAITDADRDKVLRGTNLESLTTVPAAKPVAYDVADQAIVSERLGPEAFFNELKQREVTLNPRYGVLDQEQKIVASDQSSSLSLPAAPPEGTP